MKTVDYSIVFLYYKNLDQATQFYRDGLGLELVDDRGWCKIFSLAPGSRLGLVDETRGSLRAATDKPVMITLVVSDVDAWHRRLGERGIAASAPRIGPRSGMYGFMLADPEGYTIEILAPRER